MMFDYKILIWNEINNILKITCGSKLNSYLDISLSIFIVNLVDLYFILKNVVEYLTKIFQSEKNIFTLYCQISSDSSKICRWIKKEIEVWC